MNPTNLGKGHQMWHAFKVVGRELNITSLPDFRQRFVDLRPQFLLEITVLGQLPKPKGQLKDL